MFIDMLAELFEQGFLFLKDQILHSSLYFLILWPFIHALRARRPAVATCLCWLVLLRLIIPVNIPSPFSLLSWFETLNELPDEWIAHDMFIPDSTTVSFAGKTNGLPGYVLIVFSSLWLCVSVFLALEYLAFRKRIACLISEGKPLKNSRVLELVAEWKTKFRIKRKIRMISSSEIDFPFTIGTAFPTIVIPTDLVSTNKTHNELQIVIAHELGHIRRFDDLFILILIFFKCVFFFHPAVWLCSKYIHECREKLCDREVLSLQTINLKTYAQTLIYLASRSNPALQCTCGRIAQVAEGQLLKKRIAYLAQSNSSKRTNPMKSIVTLTTTCCLLFPIASHTNSTQDTANFISPVETGWVSSTYGDRPFPIGPNKGKIKFHRGIDIAGKRGTPILAAADGLVIEAVTLEQNKKMPALGTYIVLQHANNYISRYTHLDELHVTEGEKVSVGNKIGSMGNSGQASGPHLHFEILHNSETIDPQTKINFAGLNPNKENIE